MDFKKYLTYCDLKWIIKVCLFLIVFVCLFWAFEKVDLSLFRGTVELQNGQIENRQLSDDEILELREEVLFKKIN